MERPLYSREEHSANVHNTVADRTLLEVRECRTIFWLVGNYALLG
jgi:hypothetical protein